MTSKPPFWMSDDGTIVLHRIYDGLFILEYQGVTVMEGSFERLTRYMQHEFL
jgi:hypothetical protein